MAQRDYPGAQLLAGWRVSSVGWGLGVTCDTAVVSADQDYYQVRRSVCTCQPSLSSVG